MDREPDDRILSEETWGNWMFVLQADEVYGDDASTDAVLALTAHDAALRALVAERTAEAMEWAESANQERLLLIDAQDAVAELTAERDAWEARFTDLARLTGVLVPPKAPEEPK